MVPAQGSRAPLPAFTIGLIAGDERPKGSQDQTVPLCPIPRKEANNSHFLEKPPRSRGKRVPSQRHLFCRRETPALTGQTLTTQYKLSYTTRKPFQQAIPLLPTFTADINAAENIRRQGLLILTERHRKGSAPARTDRPYRAQIRALGTIFRSPQRIYTPGSKNRLTGQMREVKDRTTDLTKASATPQTKKRLPPRPSGPLYRRRLHSQSRNRN